MKNFESLTKIVEWVRWQLPPGWSIQIIIGGETVTCQLVKNHAVLVEHFDYKTQTLGNHLEELIDRAEDIQKDMDKESTPQ
jgi:hypothetical protein